VSRFVLATVLVLPLVASIVWFSKRRQPVTTPFEASLDRAVAPVLEQRELQTKLRAVTARQARLLARELAQRSVPYLAPRDLDLWAATRERVARSSPVACAKLWKGGDDAFLGPAIAELGDDALDAYTAMLARGLALRLERRPPPSVAPGSIQRGFRAVAEGLDPQARAAFERDSARADVSDARACELFLILAGGAARLEQGLRTDFYRALAADLAAPK
jgi:hypothetical protein